MRNFQLNVLVNDGERFISLPDLRRVMLAAIEDVDYLEQETVNLLLEVLEELEELPIRDKEADE